MGETYPVGELSIPSHHLLAKNFMLREDHLLFTWVRQRNPRTWSNRWGGDRTVTLPPTFFLHYHHGDTGPEDTDWWKIPAFLTHKKTSLENTIYSIPRC